MTEKDRGAYNGFEDLQREEEELTPATGRERGEKGKILHGSPE